MTNSVTIISEGQLKWEPRATDSPQDRFGLPANPSILSMNVYFTTHATRRSRLLQNKIAFLQRNNKDNNKGIFREEKEEKPFKHFCYNLLHYVTQDFIEVKITDTNAIGLCEKNLKYSNRNILPLLSF